MLAPKERDFLFVGDAPGVGSAGQAGSPFFQGYGPTEIHWVVLTYSLWERAVQDLIECAKNVFFRDDLGEETKADPCRLFRDILSEGNEIDVAIAAATHLH